jgi:hypothetical protein
MVTGRLGHVCEEAAEGDSNTAAAAKAAMQNRDMNVTLV